MLVKMALIIFLVIPIIVLIIFGCIEYERMVEEDKVLKEAEEAAKMRVEVKEA